MIINHHTLSDFRVTHHSALDLLFTQMLAALNAEGLISLETATLDGTKIAAQAGSGTFRKEDQLVKHLATLGRKDWHRRRQCISAGDQTSLEEGLLHPDPVHYVSKGSRATISE